MDVAGIKPYPVFDALKGKGTKGKFTFPTQAAAAQKKDIGVAHQWTVPKDMTLISTAGHLHPGGLYNDLTATRSGTTKELFRSEAKYYEPAGAVSWDVSMTGTKPDWRVALHPGDQINTTVTYDTSQASWYESMGIMVVFYADGIVNGAKDPFTQPIDTRGLVTHGHLKENDNHGGAPYSGLPDARDMLDGSMPTNIDIKGYIYGRGDLSLTGVNGRPPTVQAGHSLTFTNLDATRADDGPGIGLPHDHRLQAALRSHARASPIRSPTATCSSTPASSATAPTSRPSAASSPPPRSATRGRRPRAWRPAPTPTSAASTPSCAAPSGSSAPTARAA